jgi:hypothetical protein
MTDALQRIVAVALTVGLILVILELVRRKRLMERYALLWLFCSVALLVMAAWKGLLSTVAFDVGIHYPPALLFAAAFGAELLLLLHFSLSVSSLTDQNKILAQRLAILQRRLDEQGRQLAAMGGESAAEYDAERTEPEARTKLSSTG